MDYFYLDFFGLKRKLPIVPIAPKVKIASLSLLGDVELTEKAAEKLAERLKDYEFDYLVGPEVKVVPLLLALSQKLGKKKFIVCRKSIKGYMTSPKVLNFGTQKLVLDGPDAELIKGKKVAVVDDVISSGTTIINLKKILDHTGANITIVAAIFMQGERYQESVLYLSELPVFEQK